MNSKHDHTSKNEESVILLQAIDRNKKYVVVERTQIGLFHNSIFQIEYFYRIDLLRRINHPCFPRVLEVFDTPRDYTIVFQYDIGKNLDEFLKSHGALENKVAIQAIVLVIVATLEYLHGMNIAHRNLDPTHLRLSSYYHFHRMKKLTITGLSRITQIPLNMESSLHPSPVKVAAVSDKHLTVFSAPELCKPNHGLQVDLYSLGVIIYSLVNGQAPIDKGDINIDTLNGSRKLKHVIRNLLSDEPSKRYSLQKVKKYFTKLFLSEDDNNFVDFENQSQDDFRNSKKSEHNISNDARGTANIMKMVLADN